jgi:hypothetical protein
MHEQAWLWLSAAVDTRDDQIVALENVLTINPDNQAARRGLQKLGASIPEPQPPPPPAAPPPAPEPPPAVPARRSLLTAVESHGAPIQPEASPRASRHLSEEESWRAQLAVPTLETVPEALTAASTGEAWQKALERQEAVLKAAEEPSSAEPTESRSILDLFDAWAAALIFKVEGTYEKQVQSGNVGHTLVSLAFAGVLSGVATLLMLLLVIGPMGGVEGLLMMADVPADPATIREVSQFLNMMGIGLAAVVFLGTIIGQLINGSFVHLGARILGGEGEWFQTLSGLSLATVAGQIVYLVPTVLLIGTTFLGVSFATVSSVINLASFVLGIYQTALNIVAVKTAHNFSGWRAFFAMFIGGLILSLGACCLGFGLVSLLGAGAGAMAPQ